MSWFQVFLLLAAVLGNTIVWITFTNHLHGTATHWFFIRTLTRASHAAIAAAPAVVLWMLWRREFDPRELFPAGGLLLAVYGIGCIAVALGPFPFWLARRLSVRVTDSLLSNHSETFDVAAALGRPPHGSGIDALYAMLPGNEVFHIEINEKALRIERLPPELEGLRVAHLSDLHLCGSIHKDFFHEVVRQVNLLEADLVAITGDLLDDRHCLPWIPEILSALKAPHGVYALLGNHDLRTPEPLTREALGEAGIIDIGRRYLVEYVRGYPVVLGGNELPWFTPAADLQAAPREIGGRRVFRLLLTHSPDQYEWAKAGDADLLLAGHMHGGQICLPWIGPILGPSPNGVRYAAGVFHEHPTVMHVSRGVGAICPVRYNCQPEITELILHRPG